MQTILPEMIPKIIADKDEISIYYIMEQRGVAEARRVYHEAFGVPVNDKTIDAEIEGYFLDDISGQRRYLPRRLLLALLLREGAGRGRGKPKSIEKRLHHARAKHRYDKVREAGKSQDEAIEIVRKDFKISAEAIRDGRVNRKRKPNRA
jgi:hypothetical protein